MREIIYVCRDCDFVESHGEGWGLDKCPYCRSDDWVEYIRNTEDDDE